MRLFRVCKEVKYGILFLYGRYDEPRLLTSIMRDRFLFESLTLVFNNVIDEAEKRVAIEAAQTDFRSLFNIRRGYYYDDIS